jgi:hypothetical protein
MEKKNSINNIENEKMTIFDIAKNTVRYTNKNLSNIAREYSMDGYFKLLDSDIDSIGLTRPIFEFDLKSNTVKIPDFNRDMDFNSMNNNNQKYRNDPVEYSNYILFIDSLFYQTNFLNVYTNNIFTRNYSDGKYLLIGNQVKPFIDYLNFKIPNKLPYAYCNINSINYKYVKDYHDIFTTINDSAKYLSFDYYTTQTTSFQEFEKTMKNDFCSNFDHLIITSFIPLKSTTSNNKSLDYVIYDNFGIANSKKMEVSDNLEFDDNYLTKDNFVIPNLYESYMSMVDCLGIGGSCVVVCDKNDTEYLKNICKDCVNKFTNISMIHPLLMSNCIVLVCRNYINSDIISNKINDAERNKFNDIVYAIIEQFKSSDEIDVSEISMDEIQKLTGCM